MALRFLDLEVYGYAVFGQGLTYMVQNFGLQVQSLGRVHLGVKTFELVGVIHFGLLEFMVLLPDKCRV